ASPAEDLVKTIEDFRPDAVAVSLRNIDTTNLFDPHVYYNGFVETIKIIRGCCKSVPVIAGGSGFSLFPEQIMRENPAIDFGVYLEGEKTFPSLLENLNTPQHVKGLYFRENGSLSFTGPPDLHPIEDAPPPAWHVFNVDAYKAYPFAFGIETKRGCIFKCAYCSYYLLSNQKIRLRRPERVVEEIVTLRNKYGVRQVGFTDSIFNIPSEHAVRILRLMKKEAPDVAWLGYLNEKGITEEFVSAAMDTGFKVFALSLDTFTDSCLQTMGKGMTVSQVNQVVEALRAKPPAEIGFNFFVNGPGYTYATLLALAWFILKTKMSFGSRFRLLRLNLGYIRILPGTEICRLAVKNEVIPADIDLLPKSLKQFEKCFYFNKNLALFNFFFCGILKRARRFVLRHSPHPGLFLPEEE
ncbi:MAG: cobalamin-dependent protein, partial [Desulforhabdus sp.]|nr:cobalamin-dependent protein [Desulforhabdus sp.]